MKVKIVNYGLGNIKSIQRALNRVNVKAQVCSNPLELKEADKLILPGVGYFSAGMNNLSDLGYLEELNELVIEKQTPILGICLGMQLFTKSSEEGSAKGLDWVNLETKKFKVEKLKVPHIGWNSVTQLKNNPLYKGIDEDDKFYFVHSFFVENNNDDSILTTTNYGINFVSSINKENVFATQFHPEKSQKPGLKLLENFIKI